MKPAFQISVNGTNITHLIADRLISLSVTDEAGVKSDRVELTIDDRDERLAIPPTKAIMSVAIGYENEIVDKGKYTVEEVEIEGPLRRLTIRANAVGASNGAGAAHEKSWHQTTLGQIAEDIGKNRGWEVIVDGGIAGIEIEHIDQSENDMQFLTRMAAENGAVAKVTHNRLVILPHASGKTASGKALPTVTIQAGDTVEWSYLIAERGSYKGVKARYYDRGEAKQGEVVAGDDGTNTHTLPYTYKDADSAERAVLSKKETLDRNKDRFTIRSMPGNPLLESETNIVARGFRAGVDGTWTIIRVQHQLSETAYTCSVETETPQTSGAEISVNGKKYTTDEWGNRVLL